MTFDIVTNRDGANGGARRGAITGSEAYRVRKFVEKRFQIMQKAMQLITIAQAMEAKLKMEGYILTDNDSGTTWKKKLITPGGASIE